MSSSTMRCRVCAKTRAPVYGRYLACSKCDFTAHSGCLSMSKTLTDEVLRAGMWQCPDCKVCRKCGRRGKAASLLFCDRCDAGVHLECATPALKTVPAGTFLCSACCLQPAKPQPYSSPARALAATGKKTATPPAQRARPPKAALLLRRTAAPSMLVSAVKAKASLSAKHRGLAAAIVPVQRRGVNAVMATEKKAAAAAAASPKRQTTATSAERSRAKAGPVSFFPMRGGAMGVPGQKGGRGRGREVNTRGAGSSHGQQSQNSAAAPNSHASNGQPSRGKRAAEDNAARAPKRVRSGHYVPSPEDLELFAAAEAHAAQVRSSGPAKFPLLAGHCIECVQLGQFEVSTLYHSPYPEEYAQLSSIFICEFCLSYNKDKQSLQRHVHRCSYRHPPGTEIYRKGNLSVFEIDGQQETVYCQNLCLLAKLFLDHKTLYFDVQPFLFYVLTAWDGFGAQIVGYFSKEKRSDNNYNVSCILCLPQHQRKGYGKFLIDLSYALTRAEQKTGTPERPLSDLGLLSYRSYWKEVILSHIAECKDDAEISVRNMSQTTGIMPYDVISTMQSLGMIKYWRGNHMFVIPKTAYRKKKRAVEPVRVDATCLHWAPRDWPSVDVM